MNIYKLIKNGDEFEHLLNEKNLLKTKQEDHILYNPLTYAIKTDNVDAFHKIIDFINKHEKKEEIAEVLLNKSLFQTIRSQLEKSDNFLKPIIKNFTLSPEIEYFFKDVIIDNVTYGENNIDINEYLKLIPPKKYESYEDIINLKNKVSLFNNRHKYYIETDHNFYVNKFKDFIKNYSSYHDHIIVYEKDADREELKKIVEGIDNLVLNASSRKELNELFSKKLTDFINEQYRNTKFKAIFRANTRDTLNLKNDVMFNKLNFYIELIKEFQEHNNIDKLFEDTFSYYSQERKDINIKSIEDVLKENRFKSLTIDKNADIEKVLQIIKDGSSLTQQIYGIDADDIGGTKLSLLFTFEECPQGGAAGLLPGGDLITFRLRSEALNELGKRHFVHEFTHFLQDKKYYISNIAYDDKGKHIWDDNELWQEVDKALATSKSTLEDVSEYTESAVTHYIPALNKEQKEKLILIVKENIDSDKYKEEIDSYIKSLGKHSMNLWSENFYEINNKLIDETKINNLIDDLEIIKKAHHSAGFLKTMWAGLDKKREFVYFENQLEVHSRLTESLTGIKKEDEYFLQYPTQNLMKDIKPKLEKFNQMISNYYKDFVVPYKPKQYNWKDKYPIDDEWEKSFEERMKKYDAEWDKSFEERMKKYDSSYDYKAKDDALSSMMKLREKNLGNETNAEQFKSKKR
jgi:hypothetical protein